MSEGGCGSCACNASVNKAFELPQNGQTNAAAAGAGAGAATESEPELDLDVESQGAPGTAVVKSTFVISKMDCPDEEMLIRGRLKNMAAVDMSKLEFDLLRRRLTVTHRFASDKPLLSALRSVGMDPVPMDMTRIDGQDDDYDDQEEAWSRKPVVSRLDWLVLSISCVLALAAEIIALATGVEDSLLVIVLSVASVVFGGREMILKCVYSVRARSLGINVLMTIAVAGAMFLGEWPEAAMVAALFALAEKIETYALEHSRGAIRGLMELSPDTALVQQADGSWEDVRAASVTLGQRVRIRPGDRIPLDGRVVEGSSSVNQGPITGESMPVDKAVGDEVFAGTLNDFGSLEIEVTHRKSDTTLANIIRVVQQAQSTRGQTQRFVDRFARFYTPTVLGIAVIVAFVPPLFAPAYGPAFITWLYRSLVLLVISCPCALVISTPVTIVSGLAAAARQGILVKGGEFLENGFRLRALALDKTGTLTVGQPQLTDIVTLPTSDTALSQEAALCLAARLDAPSEHPVARALVEAHKQRDPEHILESVEEFQAGAGRGVNGKIDGTWYCLGSHRRATEAGVVTDTVTTTLQQLESQGKTAVVLFDAQRALAIFGLSDVLRPTSVAAIAVLHQQGVHTVMLSGDNQAAADTIGRSAGITDVRGSLLPQDKLTAIDKLRGEYKSIGMVGDGINDAPALAKSDLGFAMGSAGSGVAIETADVALIDDDLMKVPEFLVLSRRTSSILWQNIYAAIGIKVLFFALAVTGYATLWMAVLADMGGSLMVTFNGMRLLRRHRLSVPDTVTTSAASTTPPSPVRAVV